MTTFSATTFCPQVATKVFWIKANRVLAWTLVVSPPVQMAIGMRFITGFWIDLAIFAAHGALSLALFGKPETRERTWNVFLHLMGFRATGMSERNRFLLTGYRIAIAAGAVTLMTFIGGRIGFAVFLICLYPLLRMPISIGQPIYLAVEAAMRRWRQRDAAAMVAVAVMVVYFYISAFNLFR